MADLHPLDQTIRVLDRTNHDVDRRFADPRHARDASARARAQERLILPMVPSFSTSEDSGETKDQDVGPCLCSLETGHNGFRRGVAQGNLCFACVIGVVADLTSDTMCAY